MDRIAAVVVCLLLLAGCKTTSKESIGAHARGVHDQVLRLLDKSEDTSLAKGLRELAEASGRLAERCESVDELWDVTDSRISTAIRGQGKDEDDLEEILTPR